MNTNNLKYTYGRTCVYNINYHIVWGTKYRNKWMTAAIEDEIKQILHDIAKENGFIMDNDTSGLEEIIDKIIAENADSVESYKNGNQKIFGFLMGQVVRTAGKGANPKLAKDLLTEKLK